MVLPVPSLARALPAHPRGQIAAVDVGSQSQSVSFTQIEIRAHESAAEGLVRLVLVVSTESTPSGQLVLRKQAAGRPPAGALQPKPPGHMKRWLSRDGKEPAPGPPPPQVRARVVSDYDPAASGDAFARMRGGITLRAGQMVTVQSNDNPNSWFVRSDQGAQGFVPSSVLQVEGPTGGATSGGGGGGAVPPPPLRRSSYETGIEAQMDALWEGSSADGSSGDGAGSTRYDSQGGGSSFGSTGFAPAGGVMGVGLSLRDSLRSSLASNASERAESFSERAGSMASLPDPDGYRFGSIEESPTRGRGFSPPAGPRANSGGGMGWSDADMIAPPSRGSPEHDPWAGQPHARRRGGGGGGEEQWGAPPPVGLDTTRRGRGGLEADVVVVLDWDCTITSQHMHKDTGKRDRSRGGMHSEHFEDWCQRNGVDSSRSRSGLSSVDRLDFGPDTDRVVVEYFFGGRERVAQLTAFFEWLKAQGVQLCILTNGETAAVRQLFEAGIAPWAALFGAGGWIANTYDEYFVTDEDGRVGRSLLPPSVVVQPCWTPSCDCSTVRVYGCRRNSEREIWDWSPFACGQQ